MTRHLSLNSQSSSSMTKCLGGMRLCFSLSLQLYTGNAYSTLVGVVLMEIEISKNVSVYAAAKILKERESEIGGTILLLFQPAEEGGAGGKFMVEEGVMEGVLGIHGIHVWPHLDSGVISTRVSSNSKKKLNWIRIKPNTLGAPISIYHSPGLIAQLHQWCTVFENTWGFLSNSQKALVPKRHSWPFCNSTECATLLPTILLYTAWSLS